MSNLRTDYKDDVFTGSRKYRMVDNGDGTVSFEDVTEYSQTGDTYGAAQINEVNSRLNGLDGSVYKAEDGAETAIADDDYFPFYDTSASASKKTLWSNIKSVLSNVLAIKIHDSNSAGTYGAGTSSKYGHVKLSDSINGTSRANDSVGASEYALREVNTYYLGRLRASNPNGTAVDFYFDKQNGKYGFNTNSNRGSGTFHPFDSLNNPRQIAPAIVDGSLAQYSHSCSWEVTQGEWYIFVAYAARFLNMSTNSFVSGLTDTVPLQINQAPWPDRWAGVIMVVGKASGNRVTLQSGSDNDLGGYSVIFVQLTG